MVMGLWVNLLDAQQRRCEISGPAILHLLKVISPFKLHINIQLLYQAYFSITDIQQHVALEHNTVNRGSFVMFASNLEHSSLNCAKLPLDCNGNANG